MSFPLHCCETSHISNVFLELTRRRRPRPQQPHPPTSPPLSRPAAANQASSPFPFYRYCLLRQFYRFVVVVFFVLGHTTADILSARPTTPPADRGGATSPVAPTERGGATSPVGPADRGRAASPVAPSVSAPAAATAAASAASSTTSASAPGSASSSAAPPGALFLFFFLIDGSLAMYFLSARSRKGLFGLRDAG